MNSTLSFITKDNICIKTSNNTKEYISYTFTYNDAHLINYVKRKCSNINPCCNCNITKICNSECLYNKCYKNHCVYCDIIYQEKYISYKYCGKTYMQACNNSDECSSEQSINIFNNRSINAIYFINLPSNADETKLTKRLHSDNNLNSKIFDYMRKELKINPIYEGWNICMCKYDYYYSKYEYFGSSSASCDSCHDDPVSKDNIGYCSFLSWELNGTNSNTPMIAPTEGNERFTFRYSWLMEIYVGMYRVFSSGSRVTMCCEQRPYTGMPYIITPTVISVGALILRKGNDSNDFVALNCILIMVCYIRWVDTGEILSSKDQCKIYILQYEESMLTLKEFIIIVEIVKDNEARRNIKTMIALNGYLHQGTQSIRGPCTRLFSSIINTVINTHLLKHPNFLSYYTDFIENDRLWTVTYPMKAWVCSTILKDYFQDGFSEMMASVILKNDIRASNILLYFNGDVKLTGFNQLSSLIINGNNHEWAVPEIIVQYINHNQKSDIYSIGITALELKKLSENFWCFVSACVKKDPEERPVASELLETPFIKKAKSTKYNDYSFNIDDLEISPEDQE
ncbi:kinase-like domain-containing protein [Neocallimastix sp. 'constans']